MVKLRCDGQVLAEGRSLMVAVEVLALRLLCAAHARPAPCTPLTSKANGSMLS
jgi:hypothetical protein